ncbi:MAG TPA: hypothetical protein VF213_14900 [Dongiaceae bacterium]
MSTFLAVRNLCWRLSLEVGAEAAFGAVNPRLEQQAALLGDRPRPGLSARDAAVVRVSPWLCR